MCFDGREGHPQLCELSVRRNVSVDNMRYSAASYKSLEGQKERVRGRVTAKFLVYYMYCGAGEPCDIASFQKGCPFDIEGPSEIYTGNLKGLGSSYPIGRHRSLPLLPEVVLRGFTRDARVQDFLDCLPNPQY